MITEGIELPSTDYLWRSITPGSDGSIHILTVIGKVKVKVGIDSEEGFIIEEGDTVVANETVYVQRATRIASSVVIAR
jgi:hypothetical protein